MSKELKHPIHDLMYKLPKYYRRSDVTNALMYMEGDRRDAYLAMAKDIAENCYIDTATWGLEIFERQAGIVTDPSKPIEDRRAVLRTRYGGFGVGTIPFLKQIAKKFENGDIEIENDHAGYTANVEFVSTNGVPPNIQDIQRALEDAMPAHYRVIFRFRYLTWDALDAQKYTWNAWDALNLEWQQVSATN